MFAQRKALENSEKSLSEFIPYSAVIAPGVVICREGDLVATVKISGKVFEAVSNEALQRDAERQNNFLKVMASASSTDEMSLKVHRIRSPDNGRKSVFRSCRLTKRSGTFRFSGVLIPLNFKRHWGNLMYSP